MTNSGTLASTSLLGGGGSGQFTPLKRSKNGSNSSMYNPFAPSQYDRMNFKASKDPVFVAYEHLDKQPVSRLLNDFIRENFTIRAKKLFGQAA